MERVRHTYSLSILVLLMIPIYSEAQTRIISVYPEMITDDAATGDGGNAWGGNQCRIVRTGDAVFTVYTSGGKEYLEREFHLVKRTENGWKELAVAKSGREPVNLMASPDGSLHIIAYPGYTGTHFYGHPEGDTIHLRSQPIPALYKGHHPYNSAGIDSLGNICALSTSGGEIHQKGAYLWAYYHASSGEWQGRRSFFDYRYCYVYIFPHPDGSVTLESTRDVVWEAMNYRHPAGRFRYMFNGIGVWIARPFDSQLVRTVNIEEFPTAETPYVYCAGINDAYFDTDKRLHVLSRRESERTNGIELSYHSIFDYEGTLLSEREMSPSYGIRGRFFQDAHKRYYIIGDSGLLCLLDENSWIARDSVYIDLAGYEVRYSGYGMTVPRTGSKLSDTPDFVFPSGELGNLWLYFKLDLNEIFPL